MFKKSLIFRNYLYQITLQEESIDNLVLKAMIYDNGVGINNGLLGLQVRIVNLDLRAAFLETNKQPPKILLPVIGDHFVSNGTTHVSGPSFCKVGEASRHGGVHLGPGRESTRKIAWSMTRPQTIRGDTHRPFEWAARSLDIAPPHICCWRGYPATALCRFHLSPRPDNRFSAHFGFKGWGSN